MFDKKVQCRVCGMKQPESDVCSRCGVSLPQNPPEIVEVEKIVEKVVEKIVEVHKTVTIEQEKPVYVCPHPECVHCAARRLGADDVDGLAKMDELEKRIILTRFKHCDSSALKAAESLGIGKSTMYRKLSQYGVSFGVSVD